MDGTNLTIDFNDASFDESSNNEQPVPGVDNIDVVFPLGDDSTFASADNRNDTTNPANAIALMPSDSVGSMMEEFLFEFDNDLDDDGDATENDQGLRITTSGHQGQSVQEISLQGTFENLHADGNLDIYINDGFEDANGNHI